MKDREGRTVNIGCTTFDGEWGAWMPDNSECRTVDGGQRMKDGEQKWRMEDKRLSVEDRGWRTEDGGQKMEGREWRAEDGGQMTEDRDRGQKIEDRR